MWRVACAPGGTRHLSPGAGVEASASRKTRGEAEAGGSGLWLPERSPSLWPSDAAAVLLYVVCDAETISNPTVYRSQEMHPDKNVPERTAEETKWQQS